MLMLDKWLGRWFMIKTFDNLDNCDVAEIWPILAEPNDELRD